MTLIGEHIAAARRSRGLGRKAVAELVGRSEEWLRLIETGQRQLDSIASAKRLSSILGMSNLLNELGFPPKGDDTPTSDLTVLESVRDTLIGSAILRPRETRSHNGGENARIFELSTMRGWNCWLRGPSRYTDTLTMLPTLLRSAASMLSGNSATQEERTSALAAHHLAASVLARSSRGHLAWLAADRAVAAAQHNGPPELMAVAVWHLTRCLLLQENWSCASQLSLEAMEFLTTQTTDRRIIALRGALFLNAAEAAGGMTDWAKSKEFLSSARKAASQFGADELIHYTPFGPTEVEISSIDVAIRLGRSSEALNLARRFSIPDNYPTGLQVRHFLQLAILHMRRQEDIPATFALSKIAEISPEDFHYDPCVRHILQRLLHRDNRMIRKEVRALAKGVLIHVEPKLFEFLPEAQ